MPDNNRPASTRAAPWVWALAALLLVVGSCFGLSATPFLAGGDLLQQVVHDSQLPPEQANLMLDNAGLLGATFLAIAVLTLLLAIALGLLGFGVRNGQPAAVFIARVLVFGLALGLVGLALISTLGALLQAQPAQIIFSLLVFGAPAALSVVTALKLFGLSPASAPHAHAGPDDEPWNAHLPPR